MQEHGPNHILCYPAPHHSIFNIILPLRNTFKFPYIAFPDNLYRYCPIAFNTDRPNAIDFPAKIVPATWRTHDGTPDIVQLQCLLAGIEGSLGGSVWRQKGKVSAPHHSVSESPAHAAEDECDPAFVLFILFFYASCYFMLQFYIVNLAYRSLFSREYATSETLGRPTRREKTRVILLSQWISIFGPPGLKSWNTHGLSGIHVSHLLTTELRRRTS
jgi:hypothetical protein